MKKILFLMAALIMLSSCEYMPEKKDIEPGNTAEPVHTSAATAEAQAEVFQSPSPNIETDAVEVKPASDYDMIDSKGMGWGFVRKKGAPPEITAKQKEDLEKYRGVYMDENNKAALYLTFDEGYENGFTSRILDILAEKNVPAAFFVTGPYLKSQNELIQRMIDEGHIVGNHTVNHLNLANQPVETVQSELEDMNKTCEEIYGVKMKYMRPPEGEYSPRVLAVAKDMGYTTVFWSMAYKDWDVNIQNGAEYAYDQIVPYLHGGAIILLHAVSADNTEALGNIIDTARGMGYEFRSLDDLSITAAE